MSKEKEAMECTKVWQEYEKGKQYNYQQQLYEKSKRNYNFYHGKQWENIELKGIQPITLNIIKSIVKYKVGVVKTKTYQIFFNSDTYENQEEREQLKDICDMLNRYANRMWEKNNINKIVRECIKDACIDNEGIVYFYTDSDEKSNAIYAEQVNRTNIYYGNENEDDIQKQPYIIISFRRTVESVKEEAKQYGLSKDKIDLIQPDNDIEEQSGSELMTNEIVPMCLVLLKLYKDKDGNVHARKYTRLTDISKDLDLGIKRYPIAHILWERVKGSARGQGEVEYLIPNQVEINKTATRRALAVKILAFPKLVVNTKYIANTKALNKVGTTIEVNEMSAQDVSKVVNYLRPEQISPDAYNLQKELQEESQNLAGASDTVTGNIDPTQASGKAIMAQQQASQQPINEQIESYKDFIEDIARIWYEMLKANSVEGLRLYKEEKDYSTNQTIEQPVDISYEDLNKHELDIKIEITSKAPFDKFAMEMSLENLLANKFITFEEYVNALPDDSVMPKAKLKEILKDREIKEQVMTTIQERANAIQGAFNQVMTEEQMANQEQTGVLPEEIDMSEQAMIQANK